PSPYTSLSLLFSTLRLPPRSQLFPYTTLFRSRCAGLSGTGLRADADRFYRSYVWADSGFEEFAARLEYCFEGRQSIFRRWQKERTLAQRLVGAQIAGCMILLLAAGLLLRGLYCAQTVNPGFDVNDLAGAFLNLR